MRNAILCALEEKLKEDGNMPPDYKQFADDVTSAKAFHQLLNSMHPSIEFSMEIQVNNQLPFWVYCWEKMAPRSQLTYTESQRTRAYYYTFKVVWISAIRYRIDQDDAYWKELGDSPRRLFFLKKNVKNPCWFMHLKYISQPRTKPGRNVRPVFTSRKLEEEFKEKRWNHHIIIPTVCSIQI